ncbi:hypothetical protein Daus18300_008536 [Diaporthe australafricana]|uniref:Protein kinase domain-containing protein n=1 Tax=Diaporthe australafricana TaxID=127596 RepID=A0ABR3WIC0_9PEZI
MDAASLSFELFATCVKVYKLLLQASDMPRTFRYLHVRLRMERDKLVDWGVLVDLSEDERTLRSGLHLNRHTVNDALHEIKSALLELTKVVTKHHIELEPTNDKGEEKVGQENVDVTSSSTGARLQKKAEAFIENTRRFPRRLRWALSDSKTFETALSKLTALNESMSYLFERHQRERHLQLQELSFMGILQANNKLEDLIALMGSLGESEHERNSRQLTRFKALHLAVETSQTGKLGISSPGDALLVSSKLSLKEEGHEGEHGELPARSAGKYEQTPVWIEWKYYEPIDESDSPPDYVSDRLSKLARLLRDENKPKECRVPPCLGYIHDEDSYRYGFVFSNLANPTANGLPSSLYDLLLLTSKPSLTLRLAAARQLATSVWYLHAANWLHKGLRSENISFMTTSDPIHPSAADIFLTGFEYARPADPSELTEAPSDNRLHDLYRHPSTQFDIPRDGRRGFQKVYDIYSLGVVLYEIGMWRPVHAILGVRLEEGIRSAAVKSARDTLVAAENLRAIEAEAGAIFATVVHSCLKGDFVSNGEDTQGNVDAELQIGFGDAVVRELNSITI